MGKVKTPKVKTPKVPALPTLDQLDRAQLLALLKLLCKGVGINITEGMIATAVWNEMSDRADALLDAGQAQMEAIRKADPRYYLDPEKKAAYDKADALADKGFELYWKVDAFYNAHLRR